SASSRPKALYGLSRPRASQTSLPTNQGSPSMVTVRTWCPSKSNGTMLLDMKAVSFRVRDAVALLRGGIFLVLSRKRIDRRECGRRRAGDLREVIELAHVQGLDALSGVELPVERAARDARLPRGGSDALACAGECGLCLVCDG